MNLIVNVSNDWAIGNNNNLLFHLSSDMKFFKEKTTGNVIVMGRKTLDSFPGGKPLPNRVNIVLTHNKEFSRDGVIVCHSLDELLNELKKYDDSSIFVIGGDSVYKLMLPYCDAAYVTKVYSSKQADTFMVNLDKLKDWSITYQSDEKEEKGYKFRFITYTKEGTA